MSQRVACFASVPFQLRSLEPIAQAFADSLVSHDADEVKAWKPDAVVVTAEQEIPIFRTHCSARGAALFALRHGAGNKYIAPCREYALADYICGSEWDQQDFRRVGIVPLREFLLTGNPWVDETFRLPAHDLNRETPTVLFAPTWNPQTSAARLLTDHLVPLVRQVFPNARVVIRPHPNILTHDFDSMRPHAALFKQWITAWRSAAQEFPDVRFVDDAQLSISALFKDADILVSDGSSLIYEFTALERPILLYTSGEMPDFGEIDPLALANRFRDVGGEFRDEKEFVESLRDCFARHEQTHRARQRQVASQLFGKCRDGRSTDRVVAAIQSILRDGHRPKARPVPASPAGAAELAKQAGVTDNAATAYKLLVDALAHEPHHVPTLVALADVQMRRQNWLGAQTELALALELDPNCAEALALRSKLDQATTPPPVAAGDRHERIACPFCGSTEAEKYRTAADIVKCRRCRTVYLRTRLNAPELDRLYQTYVDDGSHLKLPREAAEAAASPWKRDYLLEEILGLNPTRGALLDVGCSWGAFLLGARDHGFQPVGIEITRKAVRFANETLGIPVFHTQFLDTPFDANSLQVVTMIHVLEHLPKPKQAIAKAFNTLQPGGLFCGIVPNIESFCSQHQRDDWYWLDPNYHYVHYSPATLRAHLEAAGFEVVRLYTTRGDFDTERIQRTAGRCDDEFLRELEAKGQGEELRFFARKPIGVGQCATSVSPFPIQKFPWPAALDPFVYKHEGRYFYLNEAAFDHLDVLEPFYFHCGGAGDAFLLLATFYDRESASVVVSYPNSIPAACSLFDAFPALTKIYLLPEHRDVQRHARLRALMPTLPNCKGMGVSPRGDFAEEWNDRLDIFRDYGVNPHPQWAQRRAEANECKRAAVAPRGSLVGMAGSKRNAIESRDWPEVIRLLRQHGYTPVILGTPDERTDYPCLDGCEERRSFSFREQMDQIAASALFVGADSWGKTFAGLAGVPTIVFEAQKGRDWRGLKDPSDFVFLDPWDCIQVVTGLEHFKDVFSRAAGRARPPGALPSSTIHVAWEGTFADNGSLSHVNRELARALTRQPKIEVARVGDGQRTQAPTRTQVTVRHAWPPNWQRPKHGAWVLIQPWEFGALPADWVARLADVDEVWTPSEYVRRVYVDSGVTPGKVKIVPNGVDPEKFHPGVVPMDLATGKRFKFLFVGGLIGRKGPDILLEAYRKAFTSADDVCLVIKDIPGIYDGLKFEPQDGPEILYLKEDWPTERMPALYAACDCLVMPYRGEGFCLPVLEAMACGLPAIVTAGGATDDFATDEFAYRISASRKRIGYNAGPFKLMRPGWWLEPALEELKERMRWVVAHRDEARAKGCAASEYVRREWTWECAAEVAACRLREVAERPKRKKAVKIELPACARLPRPFDPKRGAPPNPRLTVCLIAKNEERFLAQCLRSVKDIAWQVVVVDTGSTDRTKEIAREFGAEVHDFKWCDDFSAARNMALEHTRGDWVLMLDADEELTAEGAEILQREMEAAKVMAYRLPIVDVGREDEGCSYVPRLFRNASGLFYVGRVHEQVFSSIEVRRREWGLENRLSQATLRHHGYTPEMMHERNKIARNLRLLELAIEELPDEPNLLMNYGLELMRSGQSDLGLQQYIAAARILQSQPKEQVVPELRESLLTQLCTHLMAAKKFEEIVTVLDAPLAREHGGLTASLHFARGLALMELRRHADAARDFRECLAKRDTPALTPINRDIRKAGPHHCLAICLMYLKQLDAAGEAFQAALAADPQSRRVRLDFAVFLTERGLPVDALKTLHALVAEKADDAAAWQLGGRIALSQPEFLEFARDWTSEAIKQLPRDPVIKRQRTMACLLAALVQGEALPEVPAEIESILSREFVDWYRRGLSSGATTVVTAVNGRASELAGVLPGAGRVLQAALAAAMSA